MHDVDRTQLETGLGETYEQVEIPELSETYEVAELGSILSSIFGEMPGETLGETYETFEARRSPLTREARSQLHSSSSLQRRQHNARTS
jgi:hypothetical protein